MLHQMKRLARHSVVYGIGGLASRLLAVLLLPLYTRYLRPSDYGAIETLIAGATILMVLLRAGIRSAFFRYYYDYPDEAGKLVVVRTSFWFTMASATAGLIAVLALAVPISQGLFGTAEHADLVRATALWLWAQVNYEQATALFRVEERSVAYVIATLINLVVTVGVTVLLVVGLQEGPLGVILGNASGTLLVYFVLLAYRSEQFGLQFDRALFREMNRFGMPLVPSALALWAINFSDRFFLVKLAGVGETGLYSIGVRIASVIVLLLTAFRTAWPAFAYSIEDDSEAKRTYSFVLTYLLFVSSWLSLALGLLAPWIVRVIATPDFYGAARVVGPLAFATTAYAGYAVVAIGLGRARETRFNWVVTGVAAVVNVGLNLLLIPPYGMMGAAYATVGAYVVLFVGMTWKSQQIYPVPYQWRRVILCGAVAVALNAIGRALDVPLAGALLLVAIYPLLLIPLGFYLPFELRHLRAMGRALFVSR